MTVSVSPTPNPNAVKVLVGHPVGGPATVRPDSEPGEQYLADLVAIDGVASVFFTADFFTITKTPSSEWDAILAEAVPILEEQFGA